MTRPEIKLDACPCCGGEARAQFEVYGTWVRVFCVACGLSTRSEPTRNFDIVIGPEKFQALVNELKRLSEKSPEPPEGA